MARRTKEDALVTRQLILDAAETLFRQKGVSRTSLQQIAKAANVTRGAIYWHFNDKVDLFQALLDRAALPCDEILNRLEKDTEHMPIERILILVSTIIKLLSENEQIRNTIDIIIHKIELVDEFAVMNERYLHHINRVINILARLITQECEIRKIPITKEQANNMARALNAIVDGFSHTWVHNPDSFDLHEEVISTIKTYLYGFLTHAGPISASLTVKK